MSYLAVDSLFPEWKIWTQFVDETTGGLRLDGLVESHPIEVRLSNVAELFISSTRTIWNHQHSLDSNYIFCVI